MSFILTAFVNSSYFKIKRNNKFSDKYEIHSALALLVMELGHWLDRLVNGLFNPMEWYREGSFSPPPLPPPPPTPAPPEHTDKEYKAR